MEFYRIFTLALFFLTLILLRRDHGNAISSNSYTSLALYFLPNQKILKIVDTRSFNVGGLTDVGRHRIDFGREWGKKVAPRWRHVGANQMLLHAKCFWKRMLSAIPRYQNFENRFSNRRERSMWSWSSQYTGNNLPNRQIPVFHNRETLLLFADSAKCG